MYNELMQAVMSFIEATQEIRNQNPSLEVTEGMEGPSTLGRLEVDSRLVIPAKTHLRDLVTSVDISSVVPSEASEGVTVLPQTRPLGGQSEAAETALEGKNQAVEQAGPSSRHWRNKSITSLNSSDWRSLAQCFDSPGDEASSRLPNAPAPIPHPDAPNPPEVPPLINDEQRLLELRQSLCFSVNEMKDLSQLDSRLNKALEIEKNVERALLEDGFNAERIYRKYENYFSPILGSDKTLHLKED
ncbi:hypothetical protein OROMI_034859 [Orobanche minor]